MEVGGEEPRPPRLGGVWFPALVQVFGDRSLRSRPARIGNRVCDLKDLNRAASRIENQNVARRLETRGEG